MPTTTPSPPKTTKKAINLLAGLSLVSAYYFSSKSHYRVVQFVGACQCPRNGPHGCMYLCIQPCFSSAHRLFPILIHART